MIQQLKAIARGDLFSGAVVSVIDQAMLSGLNLLIGLAIISVGAKADYGIYVQLFTLMLLSQSLQDALIGAPMMALAPKARARRMRAICAHLYRLRLWMVTGIAAIAILGVLTAANLFTVAALDPSLALPFAAALVGQSLREYARDYAFLELDTPRVLLIDLVYVGLVVPGLGLGIALDALDVDWVFSVVAVAGAVAGAWGLRVSRLRPMGRHGHGGKTLRDSWRLSRWALPSVVMSWAGNYGFLYVVAGMIGVLATADVSAARLLLMPVGLCSVAWASIYLPRASRWVGAGDFARVRRVAWLSCAGLAALIAAYLGVLLGVYGLLETYVLGEEYAGLEPVAVAWAVFFVAAAVRNAGIQTLSAGAHYQDLFWYTLAGLVLAAPLVVGMTAWVGILGAVYAQALVEGVMGVLTWLHGWPRLVRAWSARVPAGDHAPMSDPAR